MLNAVSFAHASGQTAEEETIAADNETSGDVLKAFALVPYAALFHSSDSFEALVNPAT